MKNRIKEIIDSSEKPPQRIIVDELANVSAATMTNFPGKEHLGIRHQRNGNHQSPNPEMAAENHVLPLQYQLSENVEQFLLFDSDALIDF